MVSIDIYIGIDKERAWLSYEFTTVTCTSMMDDDSVGDEVYIWRMMSLATVVLFLFLGYLDVFILHSQQDARGT